MAQVAGIAIRQTSRDEICAQHEAEPARTSAGCSVSRRVEAEGELVTCCICDLPSDDGLDHEQCFDEGTIRADEVDDG